MTDDTGLTQFDYLFDALSDKFPGLTSNVNGTSVFQFATTPIGANWVTGQDVNAYDIANAVPASVGGFYTPGNALDIAYLDLIDSIQPANYSSNPAYAQAQTTLAGYTSTLAQTAQSANDAYEQWVAENTSSDGTPAETKSAWLLDPLGGLAWQDKLNEIQSNISLANSKLAAIVASMDSALANAQKAATTDTMPISSGGPAVQVPAVTIGGDLGGDLARWASYGVGQYDFSVTIDGSSVVTTPWKTLYRTSVSHSCWSTSTSVDVDTSRIIEDVAYKLQLSAVGLATYPITRGAWFNPAYVNPSVTLSPGTTVTADDFFGFNGSLKLIPLTLLVMYKPTVTLTVSTEVYKQEFEANANADIDWINLFGFQFGFKGLASLQPVANADNTTTVTFASPDDAQPQIVGVVSQVEWNGSTTDTPPAQRAAERMAAALPPAPEVATVGILPQDSLSFPAFAQPSVIQIRRIQPIGSAPYVVYADDRTLAAGTCPMLNAIPPYENIFIKPGIPFIVQNLSTTTSIQVTY